MMKSRIKKNKLKGLRNSYNISQAEMASYLKVSTASYSKKESNQDTFRLKEMYSILDYFKENGLDLTLNDIWGED